MVVEGGVVWLGVVVMGLGVGRGRECREGWWEVMEELEGEGGEKGGWEGSWGGG